MKKLASRTAQATEDIAKQVKNIQQAVERTAGALANVHASVGSINEADSNLRAVFEQQTAELDEIALRAGNVAGATPQQQALPAVDYLIRQGRKRFFVLGTDTVYPRTTNAILKSYLHAQGVEGDAIAEFYTPG